MYGVVALMPRARNYKDHNPPLLFSLILVALLGVVNKHKCYKVYIKFDLN
jgi:hypothetical protein